MQTIRISLSIFSLLLSLGAQAQNKNTSGPTSANAGTPASALTQISAKQCQDIATKAAPMAEQCLKITAQQGRAQCWNDIGRNLNVNDSTAQACASVLNPLIQGFVAKEKAKYPTQAAAFTMGGNGNSNGGPNNGPNNGPSNGSSNGPVPVNGSVNNNPGNNGTTAPQVTQQQCKDIATKAAPMAEQCLKITMQQSRAQCWNDIGRNLNVNDSTTQACSAVLNPLIQGFQAKEKSKYPTQAAAFTMGGNGSNNNSGSNNGPSTGNVSNNNNNSGPNTTKNNGSGGQTQAPNNVDCGSLISKTKTSAMKCLDMANQANRKKCFDGIGQSIDSNSQRQSCQGPLDQLKSEVQNQEKQKYPSQPSAV